MKRIKGKRKVSSIICMRVSDSELEAIKHLMGITQKSASSLMREAFNTFIAQSMQTEATP